MKIELKHITIGEIAKGYADNKEQGVVGYNGLLNIRPPYQREFVYDDKKRNAVIDTIMKNYPLNVMYWVKNDDGTFEVLDGQQRTISFCQFVRGDFSIIINGIEKYIHTLTNPELNRFLDYPISVYVCEGGDDERLAWFEIINIAGEKLTEQELLNANYVGTWLASAKERFSKRNCVAYNLASDYVSGSPIRQEFLETALDWISDGNIKHYMAEHKNDPNCDELWSFFNDTIVWVKRLFPNYRKEMKGLAWGKLFKKYNKTIYNPETLESQIHDLMANDEVTNKKGIYEYVLSGCDEAIARKLSKRSFSEKDKRTAYERQDGVCPICGKKHEYEDMEGDHIVAWWRGGTTTLDNLQMLCKTCNGNKGGKAMKTDTMS